MKGKDVNWQHPVCQFLSLGRYFIFICHLFLIKMSKTVHDTIILALLAVPPRDPWTRADSDYSSFSQLCLTCCRQKLLLGFNLL